MVKKIMAVIGLLALFIFIAVCWNPLLRQPVQSPIDPPSVGKDEIKVILLGTGTPISNHLREKNSQVLLAGGKIFLVDCGGGVVSRLIEAGIPIEQIEHVLTIDKAMEYHSSTLEVADMAQRAGAKHVVLTHLMPPPSPVWYWEQLFIKGMRGIYTGKISVGRDLMTFSLK